MDLVPARVFRFDSYELNVREGELRKHGIKVRLQEQPFRILLMLLDQPGQVVLREEIRKKLWPNDTIVEFDHGINAAIKRLRDALGDSADDPRYVETLERRGYRFLGRVQVIRKDPTVPVHEAPDAAAPVIDLNDLAGRTISHYRVLERIGSGGMGVVYRAQDTKLGREVALKVLPDEFAHDADRMARFEREARVLASLNHPNIAAIHGLEESNGIRALAMELVPGPTLEERISGRAMTLKDALPIAKQIAEALEYAHEKGIVHRDLKPANVKLTADGSVKVLDFGLAKFLEVPTPAADPSVSPTFTQEGTRAGVVLGTAAYMAPEQARGATVDRRADIWAFGVLLYEMLTGQQPFRGATISDTLAAVLQTEPNLDRVPAGLRWLVQRCLDKDARRRLRDIGEARLMLEEGSSTPTAHAVVTPSRNQERLAWLSASLVAVIATILAFVHFREKPAQTRAVRFAISLPEKASFNDWMALSPDGTRLVMAVYTAKIGTSLWVQRLDSLTAHPLAGTEGARIGAFWSPDSQFIAFYAQGKLKKIDAAGGPAQTLCDAPKGGDGGTWSRDGVIVFAPGLDALYRIPADGGQATPVTVLDQARHEVLHAWPQFLPDGRHFLYHSLTSQNGKNSIYVGSLDQKEVKWLLDCGGLATYAPAPDGSGGYLLFHRAGTLLAQRIDAKRVEVSGNPIPVVEGISDSDTDPSFTVSPAGALAYRSPSGTKPQLVWFDRSGKELGTIGVPGDSHPTLSPEGRRVAVTRVESGSSNIWVLDLARGGAPSRLTFGPSDDWPVWSPDGNRVLFGSKRDGKYNLYTKAASGEGNDELLLESDEDKFPNDWSSDGRSIVYMSLNFKTGFELWVLPNPEGGPGFRKPVLFLRTPLPEHFGTLSPDGRWIAYQSTDNGDWDVYIRPFGHRARNGGQDVTGKWQVSTGLGLFPRWRRDGKELFYIGPDLKLMAVEVGAAETKVGPTFVHGVPRPLFNPRTYGRDPFTVTADGQRFLIASRAMEGKPESIIVVLNWMAGLKR